MKHKPFGWGVSLLLLAAVVVLAIVPLLLIRDSEFGGADGAAEEAIAEVAPGYEPWFAPLIVPPGRETESLLFALQAALDGLGHRRELDGQRSILADDRPDLVLDRALLVIRQRAVERIVEAEIVGVDQ